MPLSSIPGFIKKRTASQQYRRSPRQLTRDITVALEMKDDTVLPHLRIRTEDGSIIDGDEITPDIIKALRSEGKNPMWYLRREWLKKSYGLRTEADRPEGESQDNDADKSEASDQLASAESANQNIVGLMQESIRELKRDKEMLTEQLKIKDEQIRETTERWKESNYISQGLNQRLEAMERRFEPNTRLLREAPHQPSPITDERPKADATIEAEIKKPKPRAPNLGKRSAPKPKRGVNQRQASPSPQPEKRPPPKWYEMPTLKKFLQGNK